jgi:hypothetical protein
MDLKTKQRDEKQWDKLYNFMDENDFSCQDFMSCVCATLLKYKEDKFNTTIMLGDVKFDIEINKR